MLPQFPPANEVHVTNPGDFKEPANERPQLKSNSTAAEEARLVAGALRLFSVTVTNTGAVNQYLQIFDAAVAPADGSVPLVSVPVSAGQVQFYDVAKGLPMIDGIYACVSTTQGTKTLGASDSLFVIAYSNP